MILSQIQGENNFLFTSKQWKAKVGRFLYISRARRSFLCLWLWFFPTLKKGHKKIKKRVSPCQLLKYKCHASQTLFLFNIVSIGFRPPCWWFMDLIRLDGFDFCDECAWLLHKLLVLMVWQWEPAIWQGSMDSCFFYYYYYYCKRLGKPTFNFCLLENKIR